MLWGKKMATILSCFFFGRETLKRIGDIRMGVENRFALRMDNPNVCYFHVWLKHLTSDDL